MDVSGLIISALAISFEITSTLYRYGKQVRGARTDIQALSSELYGLIGVLEHLKLQHEPSLAGDEETLVDESDYAGFLRSSGKLRISQDDDPASGVPMQGLQTIQATSVLRRTLEFLQELQQSLAEPKGRLALAVHLLKWPLKDRDVKKHLQRLERVKTFFVLTLVTGEVDQSRKTYEEINALRTVIKESMIAQENEKSYQEYLHVLSWLSPVDPSSKRGDHPRTPDTGFWFTKSSAIREWSDITSSSSRTLFLQGITGAGKSTLMTATIDQLLSSDLDSRDVAFFYCSFSDDQSLHIEIILGSLLAQTLLPTDPAYERAKSAYNKLRSKSLGKTIRLEPTTLIDLLRMQAESRGHLFILIDGINECVFPYELLSSVETLASSICGIRVLFSGIDEKGIGSRLSSFPGLIVQSVRPSSVKPDISLHVQTTLSTHPRLRQLPASLKDEIMHALTQGAQGMFRWVQCQLEILTRLRTPRAVREALASMPLTLDKTYEALLLRIDKGEDAELSKQIFEILAFSLRPLRLQEVATLLQITPGMHSLDESKLLTHPTDILSICGSFLEYNARTGIVTLAHHSVKTYLTSTLSGSVLNFHLDERTSHRNLTLLCLTYLSFTAFSKPPSAHSISHLYATSSLLDYAVMQWPLHLKEISSTADLDSILWTSIHDFFFNGNFHTWVELLIPGSTRASTTPPLYYASSFGLTAVVQLLLEIPGVDIEQRGGWGGATPINIASFRVSTFLNLVRTALGRIETSRRTRSGMRALLPLTSSI